MALNLLFIFKIGNLYLDSLIDDIKKIIETITAYPPYLRAGWL